MDAIDEIKVILKTLSAAYPRNEISAGTTVVYVEMLSDIDPARLSVAVKKIISESVFFPSVAEIRAAANSINTLADDAPALERAWPLAQKYATNVLERRAMEFGPDGKPYKALEVHARIRRVVEAIGAERIWENDNPSALFAQFRDAYNNLTKQDQQAPLLPAVQAEIAKVAAARRMDAPQIEAPKAAKKHPGLYESDEIAASEALAAQSERDIRERRERAAQVLRDSKPLNSETVSDPMYQQLLQHAAQNGKAAK